MAATAPTPFPIQPIEAFLVFLDFLQKFCVAGHFAVVTMYFYSSRVVFSRKPSRTTQKTHDAARSRKKK